ncbi:uncharacterized protein METZ01_LOCUS204520 [marine metagenome]|uniref:Uncharacterized protein n=1 Tax=marine metagenome TaxID=408172 RepID=A0A382ELJ1_9ZZZZ
MIKIEYEILYRVPFSNPVKFRSHVSGKPDIRTRICRSETALHGLNTSSLYKYEVLKVWEISDEEYENAMSQAKSKHEFLKRHCGY